MMDTIAKVLNKSKKNQVLIGVRIYGDDDLMWCGYIIDFNDDLLALKHFDKYGQDDGIVIESISNIESVEYENDYLESVEYLIKDKGNVEISLPSSDTWRKEILDNNKLNVIDFGFSDKFTIVGLVSELDDSTVEISTINSEGGNEGKVAYFLDDISFLHINSRDSMRIKTLFDWKLER